MPKITKENEDGNEGDNEDSDSNSEAGSDHTDEDDPESDDDDEDDTDDSQEPNKSAKDGQKESSSKANRNNSNDLNELVTAEFERRAAGKGLKNLIAGYGIRWNIIYESRTRAYEAREVIDAILHDEYDKYKQQRSKSSRKENPKKLGHFKEIQFTKKEWAMINELNEELEGDGPTGAFILPNYYKIISELKRKEEACNRGHPMHPMYVKMIKKLETYQSEALECHTLIMATLLHPKLRLKAFVHCWPEKADFARKLLEKEFAKRVEVLKKQKEDNIKTVEKEAPPVEQDDIFEMFNAPARTDESKELEVYINNMDRLPLPASNNPKSILIWWKV
ncbi:hypothetical protein PGT21_029016 [Puccinia graminis f. sp. tritici]|uniref:hAT-like transposase RNase-H fold domain-containing protein n=1 Tax=Puccinia graminis f. sp. tritici TaxID=56615 RepID=A0A5B0Q6U0_PUCGR|nr:hypothetical protein PGT21_029016 [Puccinia graminis f. sp. tritici]